MKHFTGYFLLLNFFMEQVSSNLVKFKKNSKAKIYLSGHKALI